MGAFIQQMQAKLREKKIGHKQEFINEIVREVRIRGDEATLTYKLPLQSEKARGGEFFTLFKKWAHLDSNQGPTGYEPVALTSGAMGPRGDRDAF